EELLIRATVDADYRPDNYLSTWFHSRFNGASSGKNSSVFTSIFHFINVTSKGRYWDFDGYSYRKSTQQGFDGYLGLPGIVVRGDLSRPLGGRNAAHASHGVDIGTYDLGFKGGVRDWRKLFQSKRSVTEVVYPPADVPAQLAFDGMLHSERVASTLSDS